ncbi:MAG TPA: lipoyl(octanoyl) transferase LipB [Solirubrobacterales bacterium]|nr:lipoyl(octanoyl) transferase LipB [Solirubrobacterales bacterium]
MSAVSRPLWVIRLGTVPYEDGRRVQEELAEARRGERVEDVLLLLEHHPVYTRGRRSQPAELPMGEEWYRLQGIEVAETDRGGRVTYHGPGQLVAYPVVSLRPMGDDVHLYVRRMEEAMIAALGDHGVGAGTIAGLTGVWTAGGQPPPEDADAGSVAADVAAGALRKIGSIGVHVSRGVTTHGLAINVNNDLQPFEWIVPCGIDGCRMTSLTRELGAEQDLAAFATTLAHRFAESCGWSPEEREAGDLAAMPAPGAGATPG